MSTRAQHVVVDTSCIVALVASWHEHHAVVVAALERHLRARRRLGVAAHCLAEAYSVLTRLPPPYRLAPKTAYGVLAQNFVSADVASLSSTDYWQLIEACSEAGAGGGRCYDALIARAAQELAPCVLVTLDPRHFVDAPGVTIEAP